MTATSHRAWFLFTAQNPIKANLLSISKSKLKWNSLRKIFLYTISLVLLQDSAVSILKQDSTVCVWRGVQEEGTIFTLRFNLWIKVKVVNPYLAHAHLSANPFFRVHGRTISQFNHLRLLHRPYLAHLYYQRYFLVGLQTCGLILVSCTHPRSQNASDNF